MQIPSTLRPSDAPRVDPEASWSVVQNGRAMEAAGPAENRQTAAGFPPVLGRAPRAHSFHSPQRRVSSTATYNGGDPMPRNPECRVVATASIPLVETGNYSCRAPARMVDVEESSAGIDGAAPVRPRPKMRQPV